MPTYTRKRGRNTQSRNRAARRNLRHIKSRRSAGAQQKQLKSVQHQVVALKSKVRERAQYAQFAVPLTDGTFDMELPNGTFQVHRMITPDLYQPIFQAPEVIGVSDALTPNKVTLRNFDVQLVFSPKNSLDALTPRIVRVWWLTLKEETAANTLHDTTEMTTAGFNAAPPGHYTHITTTDGGLATMVKLNPAAFKIRYYKEFTLANIINETSTDPLSDNQPVTNTFDALKRIRFRIRAGNKLKPPRGTWRQMTNPDIMPMDQHYLCVHVGGWGGPGVDGDNAIHMDTNITVNTRMTN